MAYLAAEAGVGGCGRRTRVDPNSARTTRPSGLPTPIEAFRAEGGATGGRQKARGGWRVMAVDRRWGVRCRGADLSRPAGRISDRGRRSSDGPRNGPEGASSGGDHHPRLGLWTTGSGPTRTRLGIGHTMFGNGAPRLGVGTPALGVGTTESGVATTARLRAFVPNLRGGNPKLRGSHPILRGGNPKLRGHGPKRRGRFPISRAIYPSPRGVVSWLRGPLPRRLGLRLGLRRPGRLPRGPLRRLVRHLRRRVSPAPGLAWRAARRRRPSLSPWSPRSRGGLRSPRQEGEPPAGDL